MSSLMSHDVPPLVEEAVISAQRFPVALPEFGLGCATIGNLFRARSDEEAAAALSGAWESGVRYFDTAPHYGLGLSESRLGEFLADRPRDEVLVSTKVGRLIRDDPSWDGVALDEAFVVPARTHRVLDYSRDGVRQSIEESLTRLGLDRVDIAFVHDPELSGPGAVEEAMDAIAGLREEGVVGAIGTGSRSPEALLATVRTGQADLIMVANNYTLLEQSVAPAVLEACDEFGTRIVAAAVFNSGLLARRPQPGAMYDYREVASDVLERAIAIDDVCRAHGVELAHAAIQYPLLDSRVVSVVVGGGRPEQVAANVVRASRPVPADLWDELDERGLVPRLVPA